MLNLFFRNAGLIAAAEIVVRAKGLVLLPLLTRHLSTSDYGVWSQIAVVSATCVPLVVLSTDSAALRLIPGLALDRQKRAFSAWLTMLFGLAILVGIVLVLLRGFFAAIVFGAGDQYPAFLMPAAVSIAVTVMIMAGRSWLRIRDDATAWVTTNLVQVGLTLIATVTVVLRGEGVYQLLLYTIFADSLVALWLFARIVVRDGWNAPDLSSLPAFLRFGLPLLPSVYAMFGLNLIDRVFLVHYATLEAIGIYSVAYMLGYLVIQVVVNPLFTMYPSSVAGLYDRGDMDGVIRLTQKSIQMVLALVIPAAFGSAVIGRPLLEQLTTPAFGVGALVIPIITVGYLFHMLASYFDILLGLVHRQHISTLSITLAAIANLLLNFALIPSYGIVGAAIATAVAFAVQLIISFVSTRKYFRYPEEPVFVLRVLVASTAMALGVFALESAWPIANIAQLLAMVVFGAVLYFGFAKLFGVLKPSDLERLWGLVKLARHGNS